MSFTGCSVCSSDFVRDANGDPLYCPVCSTPSASVMEKACQTGADGVATHLGVTTMVVMYKPRPDGSVDLAWAVRGFERDQARALDRVIEGLQVARKRLFDG